MQSVEAKDWEDLNNADDHVFQKKSHEKIVKRVLREKNCWKKKKSNGQKDGEEIEQKNNVKKLKQKVDHFAKFLIDDDHL